MLPLLRKATAILVIILSAVWVSSCGSQEPVRVGFAGELSGKRAELGVSARNGAQLALEIINGNGGIKGRPLEMVVKDDKGDPEVAKQVDLELVKEGVTAVIGHLTSGQLSAVLEQANQNKLTLVTPTGSSAQFNNQADSLFRVIPTTDQQGVALANYAYQKLGLRQVTGIYDLGNKAYTEAVWQAFQIEFEKLGGKVEQTFTFTSGQTDLATFASEVTAASPTAVVFATSAVDAALMAQYIRQESPAVSFLAASWAQTQELLEKGGEAVEGMHLVAIYNLDNPESKFQEFVQAFEKRYKVKPDFSAAYAYEAVQVLAEALKQTGGKAEGLPEALLKIKDFPGIQGKVTMNEYGDAKREVYMAVIENGQYKFVN